MMQVPTLVTEEKERMLANYVPVYVMLPVSPFNTTSLSYTSYFETLTSFI